LKWIAILLVAAAVAVGGLTYWATSADSAVQEWKCLVTDNPNASAGDVTIYEAGNCAVLLAGCRRQSACYYTAKSESRYTVIGINISDPEVQRRLR
jgi:hypothetical protein